MSSGGDWLHYPRDGGLFSQVQSELDLIEEASTAKNIFSMRISEIHKHPQKGRILKYIGWVNRG